MEFIDIVNDAENELPVPTAWRETLGLIALAFNSPTPSIALAEIKRVVFGDSVIEISLGQIEDYPASRVFVGPKRGAALSTFGKKGFGAC